MRLLLAVLRRPDVRTRTSTTPVWMGSVRVGEVGAPEDGFIRYYAGEIIDPVDNYVNVRKGPGTNYAVVRRVHTIDWCVDHDMADSATDSGRFFYQKTNSNWWKLYDRPGKFVGYIYFDRLRKNVLPEYY